MRSMVLFSVLAGCSVTRPAPGPAGTSAGRGPVASRPSLAPSRAPAAPENAAQCGATPCRLYTEPQAAFAAVLSSPPRVLAVGESHAQRGSEVIEPSTRRFTRDLLPMLAGRASDVVIELMLPNPKCAPQSKKAQNEQKVVTEHQAKTDQDDYVALGTRAKALGIRPHALEPTCDDLSRIANAGPDVVTVSLDAVTRLAKETIEKLLAANAAAGDARMVLAYGGLMHNDVVPREERARWSFGPAIAQQTSGRYTELDLVVPEQMEDSPTWGSLPWVAGFDRDAHADRAVLLSPSPQSFVLVFPRAVPAAAASAGEPTPPASSASPPRPP